MKLLLDTHIVLGLVDLDLHARYPAVADAVLGPDHDVWVSIASLWEIAIKARLKKLAPRISPPRIADYLRVGGITLLPIEVRHATVELEFDVPTRDPFDRLLLAQAQLEGMRFVTVDRALADQPVTFR